MIKFCHMKSIMFEIYLPISLASTKSLKQRKFFLGGGRKMWDFCRYSREASLRVRAHIYLSVTIISAAAAACDCLDLTLHNY